MVILDQKFGHLTVLKDIGKRHISSISKHETTHYECLCDCGNTIEVSEPSLEYNMIKNCGCIRYK